MAAVNSGNWQTELPQDEGDWLWIYQWSCGCCLAMYGLAYVREFHGTEEEWNAERDDGPKYRYKTSTGKLMELFWDKSQPLFLDDKPDVHWWMKIELPPYAEEIEVPVE